MIDQSRLSTGDWKYVRRRNPGYLWFSANTWLLIGLATTLLSAPASEPLLTAASLLALPVLATMLWREGEPPILFAVMFVQWLSISTGVFLADLDGLTLAESYRVPGVTMATWLSLVGLMVLAVGIRWALAGLGPPQHDALLADVRRYRALRVEQAYFVSIFILLAVGALAGSVPGLFQLLSSLIGLRWAFFYVLAVVVLMRRRGYPVLALAFGYELLEGFTSFFSEYRMVFLVFALALITARPKVTRKLVVYTLLLIGIVTTMSAMWSVVKMDYRDYMNQGTGAQVALVGPLERLDKLVALIADVGVAALPKGFAQLADRVAYVEYFGRVVDRVPAALPHEGGALWLAAVGHVLTPRLLFPDKAGLSADVLNTQRYTGLRLTEQGGKQTEIPLGYMAESYIDFGAVGMFLPIGLLGLLYGWMYRYFVSRSRYLLFAYGAAIITINTAAMAEITVVKLLGGSLTTFTAMYLAFRFIVPPIHRWLSAGR